MNVYATCAEGQPWRETEDDYVIKYGKTRSIKHMAYMLGRTPESVRERLIEHGVLRPKRACTRKEIEQFAALYNQGDTMAEIAAEIGITNVNTLKYIRKNADRAGLIDYKVRKEAQGRKRIEQTHRLSEQKKPRRTIPEHLRVPFLEFILYEVLHAYVQDEVV
jgi:transposase-like protein